MSAPLLLVSGLRKSFGAVCALDGADLELAVGEIHGLVGENGAGKSTLIKVLSGVHTPDSGTVLLSGCDLHFGSVAESESRGVCAVHQESTAFIDLGLAENLFVGHERTLLGGLFLDKRAMRKRARDWMLAIGENADLSGPLSERSVAQRQLVAIARAVATDCRLLILDEPTASLSVREVENLKRIVRDLSKKGVSVLYVSHRLEEIFDLCHRVTVMRDGHTVARFRVDETNRTGLVTAMIGREVEETQVAAGEPGAVRLSVSELSLRGKFVNVSFVARAGEIVGIGGLVGSGRSELLNTIAGAVAPTSGKVTVDGKELRRGSIETAVASGMALVPEDRQHQGLVLQLSISENLVLTVRRALARLGFISRSKERLISEEQISALLIKASSLRGPVSSLSGGNQQKVVLGKWLATSPTVLLVDEPTRGVDVGAKREIHALLRKLADKGAAVVIVTSDLPELLLLSDRVIVMREGRVTGELSRDELIPESVLALAFKESP